MDGHPRSAGGVVAPSVSYRDALARRSQRRLGHVDVEHRPSIQFLLSRWRFRIRAGLRCRRVLGSSRRVRCACHSSTSDAGLGEVISADRHVDDRVPDRMPAQAASSTGWSSIDAVWQGARRRAMAIMPNDGSTPTTSGCRSASNGRGMSRNGTRSAGPRRNPRTAHRH